MKGKGSGKRSSRLDLVGQTSSSCTPLHNQLSSGDECDRILRLLFATAELGSQWSMS